MSKIMSKELKITEEQLETIVKTPSNDARLQY